MSLDAYAKVLDNLRPEGLDALDPVTAPDIRFVDPFHDTTGRDAFKAIMAHTFQGVRGLRFTVTDQAMGARHGFLLWTLTGEVPVLGHWDLTGTSVLRLDEQERVVEHVDHWDSWTHFDARLPLLGPVLRLARRKARAKGV